MEGTHAGAVCEELQPTGRTHVGEVNEELFPLGVTLMLEQRKSVRSPPAEEERVAEKTCDESTAKPIPQPLCHSGGAAQERSDGATLVASRQHQPTTVA
ncbi:hypothetical protein AV530_010543 [Patagioenas fasciata monilis]|uniref:Uncharacterized protein n=1 Tax=Patagioenas fasciata monilis TaxID=372326 RepID=A0A1V4KFD2_PATFA|nr:hypothetical protein AV530_010543 [Patagioenas fasciata monilis]